MKSNPKPSENEIIDGEESSPFNTNSDQLSFRSLVLMHVQRILQSTSTFTDERFFPRFLLSVQMLCALISPVMDAEWNKRLVFVSKTDYIKERYGIREYECMETNEQVRIHNEYNFVSARNSFEVCCAWLAKNNYLTGGGEGVEDFA